MSVNINGKYGKSKKDEGIRVKRNYKGQRNNYQPLSNGFKKMKRK
jgi:hypothetical protein